jgi:putative endonuclease
VKTTTIGQSAEAAVAEHVAQNGYKILERNWKIKVCEIDIVAKKDDVIYFVEVKYRAGEGQGSGFEYIGPKKKRQIGFAARVWCQNNDWEGDYRLLGAEVSGLGFENINITEL